jgi:predicted nucleic acid-binding protein
VAARMSEHFFCDTAPIIDLINGRSDRLRQLSQKNATLFINSIVEMELLQGAHDKRELRKIEQELNLFYRLELNQEIFDQATEWIRAYTLSHRLLLPDAIIGACAYFYSLPLLTYNRKDFKFLPGIILPELNK